MFVLTWQPVAVITIPICLQNLETWIFSYALILTGSQSFSYQRANMGWGVRRRFSWLILFAWRRCRLCSPVTMSASSGVISPWPSHDTMLTQMWDISPNIEYFHAAPPPHGSWRVEISIKAVGICAWITVGSVFGCCHKYHHVIKPDNRL